MDIIIDIKVLCKTFGADNLGNSLEVIRDLSLSIAKGEFLAIVGPSGCGKTTLLNIISGLLPASKGELIFKDGRIDGIVEGIGYMFQKGALFPWKTVSENVAFPLVIRNCHKTLIKEKVHLWLKKVGLSEFERYYPAQLSQGMRKRVALATTLITEPEVVLMDEPFGALDAQTRQVLENELLRIWEETNSTVVFVTHDLTEAIALADRIVILTNLPGTKKAEIRIDLPRPRDVREVFGKDRFFEIYTRAWNFLKEEVQKKYEHA